MLRGLYTAAAGMLANTLATDTLANNLANVSTIGFKANAVNFQGFGEMLMRRVTGDETVDVGSLETGSRLFSSTINFMPGTFRETGNVLDVALQGDGFFSVENDQGETFYTRAGDFTIDGEGYLITADGAYVQGEQGQILINQFQGPITINRSGTIFVGSQQAGKLAITHFTNNQTLEKAGSNLYRTTPVTEIDQEADGKTTVAQGFLERSNVNAISELINNIQGLRLYESLQKNIQMTNETLGRTVNDVGRYKT